jgi:ABC-type polysaccharide/polyol phosphate export permease
MSWVWVLRACLLRDFRTDRSYLGAFVLGIFGSIVSLGVFFYIARLVDPERIDEPTIAKDGYFPFVVIGLAVFSVLQSLLTSIPSRVRQDQLTGALEALFTTRAHPSAIALGYGLYDLLRAVAETVLLVLVAVLIFGLRLTVTWGGIATALIALGLTLILFAAVGVAAAGLVIAFKRVQAPISVAIGAVALLGTVYFPASTLPSFLEGVAQATPLTWGLSVIRAAMTGTEVREWQLALLALTAAASVPVAVWVIDFAVRRTKRQGTLNVY